VRVSVKLYYTWVVGTALPTAPTTSSDMLQALAVRPAASQEDVWSVVVERSGARGSEGANDHSIHARGRQSLDRALEVDLLRLPLAWA